MFTKGRLESSSGLLKTKLSKILSRLYEMLNDVDEKTQLNEVSETIQFGESETTSTSISEVSETVQFGESETTTTTINEVSEGIQFGDSETTTTSLDEVSENIDIENV